MFSDKELTPNVNGGPRNCIEYSVVSVKTRICCLVSRAVTISEPEPRRNSPAVLVAVDAQSVKDSWEENRIANGSWTPGLASVSQPNAMICRSRSDTNTCFATVGALVEPARDVMSTPLVDNVFVSSQ